MIRELTNEELNELQEYVNYEGTSIGNYLESLLGLSAYTPDHGMSEDLKDCINKELSRWLNEFRINYTFTEERVSQPDVVYKSLEYIGD